MAHRLAIPLILFTTSLVLIPQVTFGCSCYTEESELVTIDDYCPAVCGEDEATSSAFESNPSTGTCTCTDGSEETPGCKYACDLSGYGTEDTKTIVDDGSSSSTSNTSKLIKPVLSIDIPTVTFTDALETVGEDGATYLSINYLGDYIAGVYKYLLGISTLIAIVMLMIGGLQYTIFQEDKAKTRIKNAVTGLVLLLSTYLILATVNPNLIKLTFPKLKLIQEVPLDNIVESDADAAECSGELTGVNDYQDCMLRIYGESKDKVELVTVKYKNRSYRVHKLMAEDFQKALDAIDGSGDSYDITTETAGGTYNWRCSKGNTKALSFHSWGTAIDINPSMNPYCPSKCSDNDTSTACNCIGGTSSVSCETMCTTQQYDLPQKVIDAFKSNNFKWGGDWKKTKDYMHFDYAANCL